MAFHTFSLPEMSYEALTTCLVAHPGAAERGREKERERGKETAGGGRAQRKGGREEGWEVEREAGRGRESELPPRLCCPSQHHLVQLLKRFRGN